MDVEQPLLDVTPSSRSWRCKVNVIEKLNTRQARRDPEKTYKSVIMQDGEGHRVKGMIYGIDIPFVDDRLHLNKSYVISNARVTPVMERYSVPDEQYRYTWTLNRRTLIIDVNPEHQLFIQANLEAPIDPFHTFYLAMLSKSSLNVLATVLAKLPRRCVFTSQGKQIISDFVLMDQECKPIILRMWGDFATLQGTHIQELLDAGTYPIIFAKRIHATSFQGLQLTTRYDTSIEIQPTISPMVALNQWTSLNKDAIQNAIQSEVYKDALSFFVAPEDIQKTAISAVLSSYKEDEIYWIEGQLQLQEHGPTPYYIGCSTCNRKVEFEVEDTYQCSECGDKESRTIKRFRVSAELGDEENKIQFTLFTENLKKIARSLEMNTPMELMDIDDLNKGLRSMVITAAVQLQRATYQRQGKPFSLLCLHQFSDKLIKAAPLKRKQTASQDE
ncbi:unnamed protein product [Cuscuta campestris]|uniref:Replication factor A C-terminal domain-containing protein n=1 Tax=Cuscuta campestris TaxID=132261 RepID=A0A484KNT9_9ASTE|nr:unnamed protein product [Cuscuta campestris]